MIVKAFVTYGTVSLTFR